jgi:hypothetical protein
MGIIENIQNNIVVMYEIQVRTGEWRRGFFFLPNNIHGANLWPPHQAVAMWLVPAASVSSMANI